MMSADPLVSVIMPAYNTAAYIRAAVASVFAQTYSNYEVIVVNDGSPDTPAMDEALEPFLDRIVYLKQENRGLAAARNAAIAASRGRYLALLDSDDEWEPNYLAVQVGALEADPALSLVYPNARIFGDHPYAGRGFMDVCPSKGEADFEAVVSQRCQVFISVLARREAILDAGAFDPELRSVEDFDLWLRILARGGRIGYHREVLARFRKRRDSLSADPVWMATHVLHVLDKAGRTLDLPARDRLALERQQERFRAHLELALGKRAFFRLDAPAAVQHLQRANAFFRSIRLTAVCAMLRTAPHLLLRMYRWRDRILVGADTRF